MIAAAAEAASGKSAAVRTSTTAMKTPSPAAVAAAMLSQGGKRDACERKGSECRKKKARGGILHGSFLHLTMAGFRDRERDRRECYC
jgi:hypothetical protein